MKYKYKLSGLDCPNCAHKIECKLNEHKDIDSASVNFSKLMVTVTTNSKANIKDIVTKASKEIEPDVVVLDIDENIKNKIYLDIIKIAVGLFLGILGGFVLKGTIAKISIILAYIILLSRVFLKAIKQIRNLIIDENLLITISCVGAYLTNNIHEGLMVIVLYDIGKVLESIAVNNSRKSIKELMNIKPEYASVLKNNEYIKVNPEEVKIGDTIRILTGEKIPLDGIILNGQAKIDNSSLTGESKLVKVNVGDKVLSGSICTEGILELKVTSTYEDSTVARILDLVETATDRKAKTETFVSKAARIYTPTVLILAILTVILLPIIFNVTFSEALYRALVFLVISCPCAIAISVPLSYFSGLGASSKLGILIKGSDYLDAFGNIKEIIFDKTGTITTGEFSSYELSIIDNNYSEEDIIKYLVTGEKLSNHPIAKSIIKLFPDIKGYSKIINFKEISGKGIEYKINNDFVKIGSSTFCGNKKKDNAIYININDKFVGKILLYDGIKKEVKKTVNMLRNLGIATKIFTGDSKEYAKVVAKEVGIEEVYSELLPQDKFKLLEEETLKFNDHVAFVGDGINDAPSLARANLGISLGGISSASAVEASDVVIMDDKLDKIITGINISRFTNKIIKGNLIFAIGTKILVLLLSIFGLASMWQAVFADTGVTLITILNTTRILKRKY